MRAALFEPGFGGTADLARCSVLKALLAAGLMGAMRVACTQSLRGSGSLRAELNAPLCLNEIIELPKKA